MLKPAGNTMRKTVILALLAVLAVLRADVGARPEAGADAWSGKIFEEGRAVFFETLKSVAAANPGLASLSPAERDKIARIETVYPRIYGLCVNYFFQKDEPVFLALLRDGGGPARVRFRDMYLELARYCGRMVAESYFLTDGRAQTFRSMMPAFEGKDVVDLVAMSTGHFANLKTPEKPGKPRTLSPEFEQQWGLDASKFRAAHRLTKGKGVRIAVMDSGIDPTHPVFAGTRWGRHVNLVGREGPPWSVQELPMVDWGWHGTLVTSIVAKYAPEATITVYRYVDSDTQNSPPYPLLLSSIMGTAIYTAVHDGNDIINISAGGGMDTPYIREACRYAYEHNVIVVAAGPYSQGRYLGEDMNFPGQCPTALSITGADRLGEGRYGYWDAAGKDPANAVAAPNAPFVAFPTYTEEKDDYAPGISCATPIAASLAGLVVSVYPRLGTEGPGQYWEAVRRLLVENADPKAVGFEGFSPECGFGLIDAEKTVLAAIRLREARDRGALTTAAPQVPAGGQDGCGEGMRPFGTRAGAAPTETSLRAGWAFRSGKFAEAHRTATGKGIDIAVISAGTDGGAHMAAVVAAFAPGAQVRTYPVGGKDDTLYSFRPGARLASAVAKAVGAGARIVLLDAILGRDDEILASACQDAFDRNVVCVAPVGDGAGSEAHLKYAFPGHYPSVIAVASGRPAPGGGVALWECTPPSVFTHVTAPAVVPGENTPPDPAFAVATGGSLVALIMEKLPLGPKDLPGQYVMRIRDILAASAQPALLGFKSFNLRAGYGWIDAQRAVTSSLAEYLKKRDAIDEDFRKRMERHIKMQREQMERNKESK